MRQFEFPYNFDKNLINILKVFDPLGQTISCIYLPPYLQDYQTILRTPEQANLLNNMSRQEYENHISFINTLFPNKIQILLQNPNKLLDKEKLLYYINNLKITKFCVANYNQAKIIKDIDSSLNVIGSIAMKINKKILENNLYYNEVFDGFVLPFSFAKDIEAIKDLPKNFYYLLLINAYCNTKCNGTHHWFSDYKINSAEIKCPGIYGRDPKIQWENTARIRPMDLQFFDNYIKIYKLQDRGWPTAEILRDYILYTSEYHMYPGIFYNENLYNYPVGELNE